MLTFTRRLCFINHSNEKRKRRNKEAVGFTFSPSLLFSTTPSSSFSPSAFLSLSCILYIFPSFLISALSFSPLHHLSVSVCCGRRSPLLMGWPTFASLFFFTTYVLCSHAPRGKLRMWQAVCTHMNVHRHTELILLWMICYPGILDWTDETGCVVYGDKCSICLQAIYWEINKLPVITSCLVAT